MQYTGQRTEMPVALAEWGARTYARGKAPGRMVWGFEDFRKPSTATSVRGLAGRTKLQYIMCEVRNSARRKGRSSKSTEEVKTAGSHHPPPIKVGAGVFVPRAHVANEGIQSIEKATGYQRSTTRPHEVTIDKGMFMKKKSAREPT